MSPWCSLALLVSACQLCCEPDKNDGGEGGGRLEAGGALELLTALPENPTFLALACLLLLASD